MQAIEKTVDADALVSLLDAMDHENPDPAQLAQLRQYLTEYPHLAKRLGNLSRSLRERILQKLCGGKITQEYVASYCALMRKELGYPDASALEQMVIDHLLVCWVRLYDTEWHFGNATEGQHTLTVGIYWERKLSFTQARFNRAVETLARIRRLMKEPKSPVLNMLLQQQINSR